MSTRLIAMVFAVPASLTLLSGCETPMREVSSPLPGTLRVGIEPTYKENTQVLSGSQRTEEIRGPGYRSSSSYDATKLGYTLGRGANRRECTSSQEHFRSRYSGSYGVTMTRRDGYDFWCYPAPEAQVNQTPASLPPASIHGASCEWGKEQATEGLFPRACSLATEAGPMSCIRNWTEVWTSRGELLRSGYSETQPTCKPKATTSVPGVNDQRRNYTVPRTRNP